MSFFRCLKGNYKHNIKTIVSPGRNLFNQDNTSQFFSIIAGKRMSLTSLLHKRNLKAGMTVEASIVIPLFLFFFMNLLFAFDVLRLHGNLMGAMHQTGNKMAFYGYAYRQGVKEENLLWNGIGSLALSEGYAKRKIIDILGKEYLDHTCLAAGSQGLDFSKSSIMGEGDRIELIVSYKVRPLAGFIGFPDISMENRYYGRAWTGYDVENKSDGGKSRDPIVYVAENGTVYHMARNCAYLNPSIKVVSALSVKELRNEDGEKYRMCGRCKEDLYQAVVYVTSYGNKAHSSLDCSGLKRTIYALPLSETEGKGKCPKCGD